MTERIRWERDLAGNLFGYAGTVESPLFAIDAPLGGVPWVMSSILPGRYVRRDHPDSKALKAEAERMLEEFVSSLGALFPEDAYEFPAASMTLRRPTPPAPMSVTSTPTQAGPASRR